jgi:hypothetical protein
MASHFQPSLIFAGKAKVGSSLARKYYNRVEWSDSDKHTTLIWYRIDNARKKL